MLALRYAHRLNDHLEGDKKERFQHAVREVQASTVELIKKRNEQMVPRRPIPTSVARLAVDLTDLSSPTPEPTVITQLSKDDAVVPLISIAAANVIRPYEIVVPKDARRKAMEQLTRDMGLGTQLGADVLKAAERAKDTLNEDSGDWFRWVLIGLGAAAVVAATGGLALAAAPGVMGAAAVTSALAAFGPGGMIGGLLTAGTLVSAGGGSIAAGLASPGTTAGTVEAVVATQLAAAILRELQGLEQDTTTWGGLIESEMAVRRERTRLEALSDESAPTLKELKRKIDAVQRALKYLHDHDLNPRDDPIGPEETE